MHVTFVRSEPVAADITSFWFRPEKPVHYIAGQFTELHLPHAGADNRGERRWFTLSSSPTEELVSITTRLNTQDGSTYKKSLAQLQAGAQLHLADPMGDFVLPKDTRTPLVFIAAGLGITPVRSMVRWLQDTGEQRDVQLLYAASRPDQMPFLDLLRVYPLQLTPLVKHPAEEYRGETGSVTMERILAMADTKTEPYIYLSGPELLVERLYKQLIAHGVPNERLVTDYFPGYQAF